MPTKSPLSFSAGQQVTQQEGYRSRDLTIMTYSCLLATFFGLATITLGAYIGWMIMKLNDFASLPAVVGVVMTLVACVGLRGCWRCSQEQKSTQSTIMFIYIYGVILLVPIILLLVVCCFSFDNTLTRLTFMTYSMKCVVGLS